MNKLSRDLEKLEAEIDIIMQKHDISEDYEKNGEIWQDDLMMARNYIHRKFIDALIEEGMKESGK